jgi:S-methylmethionine-dependent homocysteine/selenocysteine methylase
MTGYADLERRIAAREVIILDGAVGTQLQKMGVPIGTDAWAAMALESHPCTVRRMHELYIEAGVDVITVNTYSSARHNLERAGLGDKVAELNLRAVMLAKVARDKAARERPVLIAGSVSNYGLVAGCEPHWRNWPAVRRWTETTDRQARANLREQAEILAEAGCDLLIAEATGSHTQRKWVTEACASVGLPLWVGFRCRLEEGDTVARTGYTSEEPLDDGFEEVMALGGSVAAVFHSSLDATDVALAALRSKWQGPLAAYPEAERPDYMQRYRDLTVETGTSPEDFARWARSKVAEGVQIIGGCCGVELEHIRPLRDALPARLPEAA